MSEHTNSVPVINFSTAMKILQSAVDHALKNRWNIAVVTVDPWGALVASARMDGVAPPILEIAHDKAYTAALGKSSKAFYERMSSTPELTLGLQNRPRFCAWEGGVPIYELGHMVGAIGVSGAEGKDDAACATFAVEKFGFSTAN